MNHNIYSVKNLLDQLNLERMLASGENDHFGSGDFDQFSVGRK